MSGDRQAVRSWSTKTVPPGLRLDCWMDLVSTSLWPVSEWSEIPEDFAVDVREAPLGCLLSVAETISAHRSHRTRSDVGRSADRCYLLFANLRTSWDVAHYGQSHTFLSGDVVLVDSQGELETSAPFGFQGIILKCPEHWLRSWLPDPGLLCGRRIASDSSWGRVLSTIVGQLTPDFAVAAPLPHAVLTDQLGGVLGLLAGEREERTRPELLRRIRDCIRQRCSEAQLSAADVAAALNLPVEVLHRVLAANDRTFASELWNARIRRHKRTDRPRRT